MKRTSFIYDVKAEITLTRSELEHLIDMSSKHYDTRCKLSSEQGGFIYGWMNRLWKPEDNEVTVTATIRELDLITKILEVEGKKMINGDINEYEYWEKVKTFLF